MTTPDAMAAWVRAWASDPDAEAILRPSLEPGVTFLAQRASDDPQSPVVAGAIVNVTGDVAGLGNVFTLDGDVERAGARPLPLT